MGEIRKPRIRNKNNNVLERFKDQLAIGDRVKLRPAYTESKFEWIKGIIIKKYDQFVLIQTDSGYITAVNYVDFIREERTIDIKVVFENYYGT